MFIVTTTGNTMNHLIATNAPISPGLTPSRRLKRRVAAVIARCAMGSWIVLAAMPIAVVVVCALS